MIKSQKCVFIQFAEYAERVKLNSTHRLGLSPRVKIEIKKLKNADVAELADALVSGSSEAIHVGSSPVVRTK